MCDLEEDFGIDAMHLGLCLIFPNHSLLNNLEVVLCMACSEAPPHLRLFLHFHLMNFFRIIGDFLIHVIYGYMFLLYRPTISLNCVFRLLNG